MLNNQYMLRVRARPIYTHYLLQCLKTDWQQFSEIIFPQNPSAMIPESVSASHTLASEATPTILLSHSSWSSVTEAP